MGARRGLAFLPLPPHPTRPGHPLLGAAPFLPSARLSSLCRPLSPAASPWVWPGCFGPAPSSWSALICSGEIWCCRAGHWEVTPPPLGVPALGPPGNIPGFSPGPPSTQFRGNWPDLLAWAWSVRGCVLRVCFSLPSIPVACVHASPSPVDSTPALGRDRLTHLGPSEQVPAKTCSTAGGSLPHHPRPCALTCALTHDSYNMCTQQSHSQPYTVTHTCVCTHAHSHIGLTHACTHTVTHAAPQACWPSPLLTCSAPAWGPADSLPQAWPGLPGTEATEEEGAQVLKSLSQRITGLCLLGRHQRMWRISRVWTPASPFPRAGCEGPRP